MSSPDCDDLPILVQNTVHTEMPALGLPEKSYFSVDPAKIPTVLEADMKAVISSIPLHCLCQKGTVFSLTHLLQGN